MYSNVCNDHHGLIAFDNISGASANVQFYNFSPSYVPGWNCGGIASNSLGRVTLTSASGRDMSTLVSFNSLTIDYTSSGPGCDTLSGTLVFNDPTNYQIRQGQSMYYVSYCPSDGAQYPGVAVTVRGAATFTVNSSAQPVCPSGKTLRTSNSLCY
ncbi:MAG: hypothetical protein ACXVCY_18205 [Pseudobdellovibrionaceae bacterium]